MGEAPYIGSLRRSEQHKSGPNRPPVFALGGRDWDLLDEVFPPIHTPSTAAFLDMLDFPVGGSLLEMGCGTGVIAVSAALAGCMRVVATDINPAAAANTAMNARRHGVADRVHCVSGDMFESVPAGSRFDVIFWHSAFVHAPAELTGLDMHDLAYVDPGYRANRRYLAEAPKWGDTVLLGFASRGNLDELRYTGADFEVLRTTTVAERDHTVDYQLLRLR